MARKCIAALALLALSILGAPTRSEAIEAPADGIATSYLGNLSEGVNYRVNSNVRSDGFLRIFLFETRFGRFQVNGVQSAKAFIQELKALDALDKMSQSDAFAKSLGQTATAPLRFGVNLIANPVNTIGGTASGVANMFDRAHASIADPKANRSSMASSLLGVDDARRALAVSLGVDPYTDFAPLSQKLTDMANAMVAGGLTVKLALAAIPGGATMIVSSVGSAQAVSDTVRDKTSAQVIQEVRSTLLRLDVPASSINRFVNNRNYTPADMLVTSRALANLRASNTQAFVNRAADVTTREIALFQRYRAELLAARSDELGGIVDFTVVGGFPLNRTRDGKVIAAFPLDDLAWTATMEKSTSAVINELRAAGELKHAPIIATGGAITPMAFAQLQKLGWQVVQLK